MPTVWFSRAKAKHKAWTVTATLTFRKRPLLKLPQNKMVKKAKRGTPTEGRKVKVAAATIISSKVAAF